MQGPGHLDEAAECYGTVRRHVKSEGFRSATARPATASSGGAPRAWPAPHSQEGTAQLARRGRGAAAPGCAEVAHTALSTPRRNCASKICAASFARLMPHERTAHTPGVCNACVALRELFDFPGVGLPASNRMAERSRDGAGGKKIGLVVHRAGRTHPSIVCVPYAHGHAFASILFVLNYQTHEHANLKTLQNFPNEMKKCQIFISRRSRRRACDERQGRHGDREQFGAKHARGPPRRC